MNHLPTIDDLTLRRAIRTLTRMSVHEYAERANTLWPGSIVKRPDGSLETVVRGSNRGTATNTASA